MLLGHNVEGVAWTLCSCHPADLSVSLLRVAVARSRASHHAITVGACADCGTPGAVGMNCEGTACRCSACRITVPSDALSLLCSVEGCERAARELLLQRTAPFAPVPSRADEEPGEPLPPDLLVIWDAREPCCAALARGLHAEFAFGRRVPTCRFAERCSREAGEALRRLGLPAHLRDPGQVCALVESSGVFMPHCNANPKGLIYELMLRAATRLPSEATTARLQRQYVLPLRDLQGQRHGGWWCSPEALWQISDFLGGEKFAYLDGFLPWVQLAALADTARTLFRDGHMKHGAQEQHGWHEEFWGEEGPCPVHEEPRRWSLQGDHRVWIADDDARGGGTLTVFTAALDSLLAGLKETAGAVAERLRYVDFREYAMVACYPGYMHGRYNRHCDIGRGAVLTAILYLNDRGWREEHGGKLRLYCEGGHNMQIKHELLPIPNRLCLFWSNEDCPHEVLCSRRDRFAITVWFRSAAAAENGRGLLDPTADSLLDLLLRLHPVAPLTLAGALRRAGAREDAIQRLVRLYRTFAGWGSPRDGRIAAKLRMLHSFLVGEGPKTVEALERLLDSNGQCYLCGVPGSDGAMGAEEDAGRWFCSSCWQPYGGVPH